MALDNIDRDDLRIWCGNCEAYFPVDEYNEEHLSHDEPGDRTPAPSAHEHRLEE